MLMGTLSIAHAAKVYKWVDSEGHVQYGERPPAGQGEQMKIPRSTSNASAPASTSSEKTDAASKFLDSVESERKEKQEAAKKSDAENKMKTENCSKAKRYVASLSQGGRRYEVDEEGNRNYLGEADIKKRLDDANEMVKKWCN